MLTVGWSYMAFIVLQYIPSIHNLFRVFIMKGYWILSNAFSATIEMIIWFLPFILLVQCIIYWFVYVEPNLHSGINWEFPGGLVVRILGFHCCGPGSIPGWETEIPQAVQRGQKKKKNSVINPTGLWCMINLICGWICFANILLRVFASILIRDNWLIIFFSCNVLIWCWYQGNNGLLKWIWECSFLFSFLEEFQND